MEGYTPGILKGTGYCHSLTGTVAESAPLNTPDVICYINNKSKYDSMGYDGIVRKISSDTDHYFRFRTDDFADSPLDTPHVGNLEVKTEFTKGYLFDFDMWYNPSDPDDDEDEDAPKDWPIPADTDVFEVVSLKPGVYCIETVIDGIPAVPLEISLYKNGYNFGDFIDLNMAFNCYNEDGEIDKQHQRLYFTFDDSSGEKALININSTKPEFSGKYKIRVVKARPVIIVPGINEFPDDSTDGDYTFGDMRESLGFFSDIMPCVCYNFRWFSGDDKKPNGFLDYVGNDDDDKEKLLGFVTDKFENHGDYHAQIIVYSMGGFIVRYQLHKGNFNDMINDIIFINTPFYGSDLANAFKRSPITTATLSLINNFFSKHGYSTKWLVSDINTKHLSRASSAVWEMHDKGLLSGFGFDKIVYTTSTKIGILKYLISIIGDIDGQSMPAMEESDGIVPLSSLNLKSLNENIEEYPLNPNHVEVQKIDLEDMYESGRLYNLIKTRINQK